MDGNFNMALNWALDDEGRGFVKPPHIDQPTHSGITLIALQEFWTPLATVEDVEYLDDAGIQGVYRAIWERIGAGNMMSGLDYLAFDCAVNPGISWAAHVVQQVAGAIQDGIIGSRTLASLGDRARRDTVFPILKEITVERIVRYAGTAKLEYSRGLFNRAIKSHQRALLMGSKGGAAWQV